MHVLFIGNTFDTDPRAGGTERLTADLAHALTTRSVDVTWLAAGEESPAEPVGAVRRLAIPAISVAAPPIAWRSRERRHRQAVTTVLRRLPLVDMIHVMHFSRLGLSVLTADHIREVPAVATLTDYSMACANFQMVHRGHRRPCQVPAPADECATCITYPTAPPAALAVGICTWRQHNLSVLNRRCAAVWLQTPYQRSVLAHAGLDDHLIVRDRAAYAIPGHWRTPDSAPGALPTLLFLGRAAPDKGLHVLLAAFGRWRGPARLRLVTLPDDGEYERRLRTAASDDPRIRWYPPVPRDDICEFFAGVTGLVVPSQWCDNHPTVIQYARALGVPVLCSAVPSLEHLRGDAGVRFVERYAEPAPWIAAFNDLVEDPPLRHDRLAEFRCEYSRFVDQLLEVYGTLVHR